MHLEAVTRCLKAAAEPTRLRLLALLSRGEASVGELQDILGQSQPRVSRHLRLLDEAGLVERFRDGHWIYYRLTAAPATRAVLGLLAAEPRGDAQLAADAAALEQVTRHRQRAAWSAGATRVMPAARAATPLAADHLREALDDALGAGPLGRVLVVGCRAGTLLQQLGPRAEQAVGVDPSSSLRLLARGRLRAARLENCTVRAARATALPFPPAHFHVVVLDEALGTAPRAVLAEAVRVLRAGGRLLLLDHIRPAATRLEASPAAAGLPENQLLALLAESGCRVTHRSWLPGPALDQALIAGVAESARGRTGTHG